MDFVVEGDARSVHILNAVSPAFTCSFPFAEWVVQKETLTSMDKMWTIPVFTAYLEKICQSKKMI